MRITDLLDKRSIAFDKNPANKQETLDMAVDLMCASGKINDTEAYRKQVDRKSTRLNSSLQKTGLLKRRGKYNRNW